MYQFATDFLKELSTKYWIYQTACIVVLFIYGLLFLFCLRNKKVSAFDIILAYPLSLIIYALTGYALLSFGIPFSRTSIVLAMVFILLLIVSRSFLFNRHENKEDTIDVATINVKAMLTVLLCVAALAGLCTSGLFKISLTNDSMYYFSEYPRAIVNYGRLTAVMDKFLTDASQGVVVIGTIPFLFGFDEIFGIQNFLTVCFVVFFAYAVHDTIKEKLEQKSHYIVALAIVMLIGSMPFLMLSRWLMANLFFMEYMFIAVYLSYKFRGTSEFPDLAILGVFWVGLSILRMEGALTVGFLILCILMLEYKGKDVVLYMVLPIFILQAAYLYRIFVKLTLHLTIQFMTKGKAILILLFLLCIMVFALFIKDRLPSVIKKYYGALLIAGIIALNMAVLIYDTPLYLGNLSIFAKNFIGNSGWGLMIPMLIGIFILLPKKSLRINFFDNVIIVFLLLSIVASWGRGDILAESFGDSGNRVMMQVVPLLVFAVIIKITDGIVYLREDQTDVTV